jgi:hypothetical protein
MYGMQTQEALMHGTAQKSGDAVLQEQQLERQLSLDESGELRDRLFGELQAAAQDIETALARKTDTGQAGVLQPLLEAVRLSEYLVLELWDSLHADSMSR